MCSAVQTWQAERNAAEDPSKKKQETKHAPYRSGAFFSLYSCVPIFLAAGTSHHIRLPWLITYWVVRRRYVDRQRVVDRRAGLISSSRGLLPYFHIYWVDDRVARRNLVPRHECGLGILVPNRQLSLQFFILYLQLVSDDLLLLLFGFLLLLHQSLQLFILLHFRRDFLIPIRLGGGDTDRDPLLALLGNRVGLCRCAFRFRDRDSDRFEYKP